MPAEVFSLTCARVASDMSVSAMGIPQNKSLEISHQGKILTLYYAGLKKFHHADSWWGCCVGFRAMQVAAKQLSQQGVWQREKIHIVSAHPGPGVLDAIEYVTACISTKQFRLLHEHTRNQGCSRHMKFEWWVSHGQSTIHIKLHNTIVPEYFYDLLDRLNSSQERPEDRKNFNTYKTDLSLQLWDTSLEDAFEVNLLSQSLAVGELPHA